MKIYECNYAIISNSYIPLPETYYYVEYPGLHYSYKTHNIQISDSEIERLSSLCSDTQSLLKLIVIENQRLHNQEAYEYACFVKKLVEMNK